MLQSKGKNGNAAGTGEHTEIDCKNVREWRHGYIARLIEPEVFEKMTAKYGMEA